MATVVMAGLSDAYAALDGGTEVPTGAAGSRRYWFDVVLAGMGVETHQLREQPSNAEKPVSRR